MNKNQIISKLKSLKPILHSKYNVNEIALFGSYSRDEQTPQSDIDIMLSFENITYKNLCYAAYELYNIFPKNKVQVVSKAGIKPAYFEAIKPDLIYA